MCRISTSTAKKCGAPPPWCWRNSALFSRREAVRDRPGRRCGAGSTAVNQKPVRRAAVREIFRRGNAGRRRSDGGAVRVLRSRCGLRRLKQGRTYLDEKRGEYSLRWKSKSGPFFNNVVDVPADYDPAQKVHAARAAARRRRPPLAERAGAGPAQTPRPTGRTPNRIEGEQQIYLHPSGWAAAQWWDEEQVDNILRSVDTLKRKYNIDETKIYLTGISDGGTGVYYLALKEPNPWSSYLPLNGSLAVLRNPDNGADGEMHGNNLVNAPLYVVNGENDQLYPVAQVEPHIAWLKRMGVNVTFRPQAGAAAQHRVVADRTRAVRAVCSRTPARRTPCRAVVGDRAGRSLQSQSLADHQRAASRRVARERSDRPGILPPHHAVRPCRRPPHRQHLRCGRPRRCRVHAVAVAGCDRFCEAGRRDRQWQAGVQRHCHQEIRSLMARWAARDNDRTALYAAELKIAVP